MAVPVLGAYHPFSNSSSIHFCVAQCNPNSLSRARMKMLQGKRVDYTVWGQWLHSTFSHYSHFYHHLFFLFSSFFVRQSVRACYCTCVMFLFISPDAAHEKIYSTEYSTVCTIIRWHGTMLVLYGRSPYRNRKDVRMLHVRSSHMNITSTCSAYRPVR